MNQKTGRQTFVLGRPPLIRAYACVGGRQEGMGPLRNGFDQLCADSFFGEKTWEQAESAMQKRSLHRALEKAGLKNEQVDCIFAGDLLNQCIGSAFSLRDSAIPFYGLYGACSTMGESMALASLLLSGGFGSTMAAMTSSHFCTAERQYRMPVPYGSQRTPTAQWTATAAGCVILSAEGGSGIRVTRLTCGKVVDKGIRDVSNMGAAMAPADVTLAPYITTPGMRRCFLHKSQRKRQASLLPLQKNTVCDDPQAVFSLSVPPAFAIIKPKKTTMEVSNEAHSPVRPAHRQAGQ